MQFGCYSAGLLTTEGIKIDLIAFMKLKNIWMISEIEGSLWI
jgi:hypothetical protein